MEYIKKGYQGPDCLFCTLIAMEDSSENLILYRGERAFVVLNRYPYTNGHTMVVPFDHHPSLIGLDQETLHEMIRLTQRGLEILREAYAADGFNLGGNIGEAAGAGVEDHVHLHLVPRWQGDTNFMATTANTRVIPESLEETYTLLRKLWSTPRQA
ncbi:MAG: HIT domain-containing protein [Anaerolineales bacterium]|nr:HIT domain-containing protein [Anaerolineales bacterium]